MEYSNNNRIEKRGENILNRVGSIVKVNYAHERGIKGKGIGIAILDTGIYPHNDFGKRIIVFRDFIYKKQSNYDDCGHGTHIAGIAAGDGSLSNGYYKGIAPEANIIALKVLDYSGNGTVGNVMQGIEWIIENKERYNIRVVNISVGTVSKKAGDEECQLVKGVNRAWDAGLVVCVAAGNNGPKPYTITAPGISRKVITIGSSDDSEPVDVGGEVLTDYSGRGPNASCIIKPDIVTPGSNIWSCKSNYRYKVRNTKNMYVKKSGTSMSTPIVSGACALLLSLHPQLTNGQVKRCLCESADDLGWESNRQGFGQLNIEKMLTFY